MLIISDALSLGTPIRKGQIRLQYVNVPLPQMIGRSSFRYGPAKSWAREDLVSSN